MKENKGITLVALVITIIILLILAGVTLALVLGNNGIITRAKEAKQKTEQSQIEEQIGLAYLEAKAVEGQYIESKGVNSPVLGNAMIPVDGEGNPIRSYEEWFDYKDQGPVGTDGKTSKWANAKSKDGSMWVWIPRYAYSIKSGYHGNGLTKDENGLTNEAGEIDIVFLKGTSDVPANSSIRIERMPSLNNIDPSMATAMTNYVVHPSFTNNIEQGGWDKEIGGFWVAKYEASDRDSKDMVEGSSGIIKIHKNAISYRNKSVKEIYDLCKNMNKNGNSYGLKQNEQSHLMKNSEWGAITYLAHSKYGRNKNEMMRSESYLVTGKENINLDTTTTGNIYGIYDLSGCAYEYLAAFLKSSEIDDGKDLKFKNIYTTFDHSNYGDALYETSSNQGNPYNYYAWFKQWTDPFKIETPTMYRGGNYGTSSGIFNYSSYHNQGGGTIGFRPVITIE